MIDLAERVQRLGEVELGACEQAVEPEREVVRIGLRAIRVLAIDLRADRRERGALQVRQARGIGLVDSRGGRLPIVFGHRDARIGDRLRDHLIERELVGDREPRSQSEQESEHEPTHALVVQRGQRFNTSSLVGPST